MAHYSTKIIEPEFVEFMPPEILEGKLYISMMYGTTVHKCPCGCGERIAIPLHPTGWKLIYDGKVTLSPSIANSTLKCRSHYFIRDNKIRWARFWDDEDFDYAKEKDFKDRQKYYKKKKNE